MVQFGLNMILMILMKRLCGRFAALRLRRLPMKSLKEQQHACFRAAFEELRLIPAFLDLGVFYGFLFVNLSNFYRNISQILKR